MEEASDCNLLTRLRQAEDALRARDDFLAIAAHELRSPLNALGLRLAALERMAARKGDADMQDGLLRARRSVDRYVARALMLLDVSRMHDGTLEPMPVPVRVADVVQGVVDAYGDEAAHHGATLRGVVADPELAGTWDAQMLEQILSNLVGNAIKYGRGTPVELRAELAAPGSVCFEVADGGPGIAPADRARIFEKFERLVTTARDRSGFGLGLWIVGRMVAAHAGSIQVAQAPTGGALLRVTLPQHLPEHNDNKDEHK